MSYFIFNGIDSRQFGITSKLALPPLPERTMKTTEIPGRYEPLNRLDIMRKNTQLTLTVSMPDVTKISEVNAWLQGKGDLILSDDLTKKYHTYVNMSIIPERLSRRFGNIPVIFTVEPFRYSVHNPLEQTDITLDSSKLSRRASIYVNGTADCEPLLYFNVAGKLRITVNDSSEPLVITTSGEYTDTLINGETGSISGGVQTGSSGAITDVDDSNTVRIYRYKYNAESIYIDCAAKVAYTPDRMVITNKTSGRFPAFRHGTNKILFELLEEEWDYGPAKYRSYNHKLELFSFQKNERWY